MRLLATVHRTAIVALGILWITPFSGCGAGGSSASNTPMGVGNTTLAVTSTSPAVPSMDGGELVLSGTGFVEPVRVTFTNADTQQSVGPVPANVTLEGTEISVGVPSLPGVGNESTFSLDVFNGDGQTLDKPISLAFERTYRSIDGRDNNTTNEQWGSVAVRLRRTFSSAYGDGLSTLAGGHLASARHISNMLCKQHDEHVDNGRGASDMLWQWGQFLDHDIDLTPEADPEESAPIDVPVGDAEFDPFGTGVVTLGFHRSTYERGSVPREQTNAITAWIDGSNVYGSDEGRARALRTLDGTGALAMSEGQLLPFNLQGLPNAGGTDPSLFLAGDVRCNEQLGLTAMHTLWVREHNRIASMLRQERPELSGDDVYLASRRRVVALMQAITYREFLPLLLGPNAIDPYRGYDASVRPDIANSFSTAAYRFGHSMLSSTLLRLDAEGQESVHGHLSLRDAFFRPERLVTEGGIDEVLRGLAAQACERIDTKIVEDVRSFLFGPPGAGGLDLAALNIQRGRDHGLPSYATVRIQLGLGAINTFSDVSSDATTQAELAEAYERVEDIDLWVGLLAEDHVDGAMVGRTLARLLADQFRRLRDGDRYWYERLFGGPELEAIQRTRLADVIRRNTDIGDELTDDAFRVSNTARPRPPRRSDSLTEQQIDRIRHSPPDSGRTR